MVQFFKMSSAICFNLDQFKILSSGNGLNGNREKLNIYSSEECRVRPDYAQGDIDLHNKFMVANGRVNPFPKRQNFRLVQIGSFSR